MYISTLSPSSSIHFAQGFLQLFQPISFRKVLKRGICFNNDLVRRVFLRVFFQVRKYKIHGRTDTIDAATVPTLIRHRTCTGALFSCKSTFFETNVDVFYLFQCLRNPETSHNFSHIVRIFFKKKSIWIILRATQKGVAVIFSADFLVFGSGTGSPVELKFLLLI